MADAVQVQNFGGVNDLRRFLPALTKMPDFGIVRSVGLVRDAERSEEAALESVQSSLENVGLPVPHHAGVTAKGHPMVSILILPGEGKPGMLETLVRYTLVGTAIDNCINDFLGCVDRSRSEPIRNPDKAHVFAFLAVNPNAHHSVGVAAKQGIVDLQHHAFRRVSMFLQQL